MLVGVVLEVPPGGTVVGTCPWGTENGAARLAMAFQAVIHALNTIYGVQESRSGVRRLVLGVLASLAEQPLWQGVALVWFAHIGMDRALGYGLKYDTDFKDTHLGRIGG